MAVEFNCPMCGGTLRAGDGPAGRLVRCGGCLTVLKVPDAPPLPPSDDATTDALHTRVELLPVAHPVPNFPSTSPPRQPSSAPRSQPGDRPPRDRFREDEEEATRGRSKPFWVALTLIALVLGTCGCCGLGAVVLPDPTWEEHDSDKGGFRVQLPAKPDLDMRNRVRHQPERKHDGVEGAYLWTRAENYIIAYRDIKRNPNVTDDQFLDGEIKAITADPNIVQPVNRNEPIELQGFPGREFEYTFKKGGVITGRVILAGSRVYVLVAGGQFTTADNENVQHFLESFEITDPKILALDRKRPAAAKKKVERKE